MKKPRKHYTPDEKVTILRRHLLEKEPISKLCNELSLPGPFALSCHATGSLPASCHPHSGSPL